ncbi:MAG: Nif3-like dinuclear metal center hexameric protein [Helicobacteraceae bacterium]|nr:Nif3-like dinuclear metal center hexameric protein [Helicobacteraceae bacterium]
MQTYKTLGEIYDFLDFISPFQNQESWDNSGLLIGNHKTKIKDIFLSLEADFKVVEKIPNNSLLITHHPLIFSPINSLDFSTYPSNIIEVLINKNISLIAMHTNFDLSHLNEYFTKEILGFRDYQKQDFICKVNKKTNFNNLAEYIKERYAKLGLDTTLKLVRAKDKINNIAVICGAGISCIESSMFGEFECVITGDLKYHDAMKFSSLNISIIDVGHYESECHFGQILAPYLKKINYNAIILDSQNPFNYF